MVPTSLVGLLLFVALLAPGVCYFLVRERRRPQRELSALRETASVVLIGLACDLIISVVFAIVRALFPRVTPHVSGLIFDFTEYAEPRLAFLLWWALGLLLAACILGLILGRFDELRIGSLSLRLGPILFESAWYRRFHGFPDETIYCGCALDDGSWIGGYLLEFSTEVKETADRDLVLTAPLRLQEPESHEVVDLENVSAVVVSARRLIRLDVAYLDSTPNES
jgi:hypothetical protein